MRDVHANDLIEGLMRVFIALEKVQQHAAQQQARAVAVSVELIICLREGNVSIGSLTSTSEMFTSMTMF